MASLRTVISTSIADASSTCLEVGAFNVALMAMNQAHTRAPRLWLETSGF